MRSRHFCPRIGPRANLSNLVVRGTAIARKGYGCASRTMRARLWQVSA